MKDNIQELCLKFMKESDDETFRKLLQRLNWGVRGYIFKIVKNDDAVNEVCLKTYEDLYYKTKTKFNPDIAKYSTWVYTIAKNNALKYLNNQNSDNQNICDIDINVMYDSIMSMDYDDNNDNTYTIDDDVNYIYTNGKNVDIDKHDVVDLLYDASIKCINELPENIRIVMYDRLVNNKKIETVAIDNNLPYTSVVNWLRSGKMEIEKRLRKEYSHLCDLYLY